METNSGGQEREYPVAMIRRLVNDFVHDLRLLRLHMFFGRKLTICCPYLLQFLLRLLLKKQKIIFRQLNLHVAAGHVSKTSLRLLLQRRGCLVWMHHMVDQLQCDSCLESSDAQNAQRVSLATPSKL